jgi:hypothetical protein
MVTLLLCGSSFIMAFSVGFRIGTQRMIKPFVSRVNALAHLDEANIDMIKKTNNQCLFKWLKRGGVSLLGAFLAIIGFQLMPYISEEIPFITTYIFSLFIVFFITAIISCAYRVGAYYGIGDSLKNATDSQLVALHKYIGKRKDHILPFSLLKQLPRDKKFIHLMVIYYLMHTKRA